MQIAFGVFAWVFLRVHRKTAPTGGGKCLLSYEFFGLVKDDAQPNRLRYTTYNSSVFSVIGL